MEICACGSQVTNDKLIFLMDRKLKKKKDNKSQMQFNNYIIGKGKQNRWNHLQWTHKYNNLYLNQLIRNSGFRHRRKRQTWQGCRNNLEAQPDFQVDFFSALSLKARPI